MGRQKIDYTLFYEVLREVVPTARYRQMKQYISHSDITVYQHCIKVAHKAYTLAFKLGVRCDLRALVRGALLHDYYLYDWHDPNKGFRWHGFKHHRFALQNASADFDLSEKEKNIIHSHMFPLTVWCLPKSREAWLVTLADKCIATEETLKKYKDKRAQESAE
ncbi:MAG: HD domain-containing protein [Ruminococcaceae bacterium]|nr:HD domain-containing protein [Oscillospiraceae bacterium]